MRAVEFGNEISNKSVLLNLRIFCRLLNIFHVVSTFVKENEKFNLFVKADYFQQRHKH